MRSRHVDLYNHDRDALTYDDDIRQENDPIREGYELALAWVAEQSGIGPDSSVLELGSGTGNLTARLPICRALTCVDISVEMTRIAKEKLGDQGHISYVQADVLEYFDNDILPFDILLSTYTVHHLTEQEKRLLFGQIAERLKPAGRAVFGDLMVESVEAETDLISDFRSKGCEATAADIEEEFFWRVEPTVRCLADLGFTIQTERFSTLSRGILAER